MLDAHRQTTSLLRPMPGSESRLTTCAACGEPAVRGADQLVGFCDDCLESVDPKTFFGYPEGWVMLGGGD